MHKLILIWHAGEKEEHTYKNYNEASAIAAGLNAIFGNLVNAKVQ